MSATLPQRLSELRSRIRQALWAFGLSRGAAVSIGTVLMACLADWLFQLDGGVRLILLLGSVAATAWVVYRFLVVPLSVPFNNVALALRIEDRYPEYFRDGLASSVQFLESAGDPHLGSPTLQRAVIRDTLSKLEDFDTADVLETREVSRSMAVALGLCLTAAVFAGLDHHQTAIALERFFLPFSSTIWPRQTNLRLLDADLKLLENDGEPIPVARADGFKLYAENETGRLPSRVSLEYRFEDGRVLSDTMRPIAVNVPEGGPRELAVGQLPLVKGEIEFRATGGDDESMPWHRLQVIPPPAIETLQIGLTPPPYSRRPAETLPEGVGHVHGLVGTRVEVVATASKKLKSAYVRIRNQKRVPAEIDDEGRLIHLSFLIGDSGTYSWWLELMDVDGFENADPPRYEIHGVLDNEPQVRIDLPASDLQVTADADVFVRTTAKDDIGLKEMRLVYRCDGEERGKERAIPLFGPAAEVAPGTLLEQSIDFTWKLNELALEEGARVVFHSEATDDFDLTDVLPKGSAPPLHVGRSISRTLTVVSREQKTQELSQRQASLLDDLERAFRLQKQVRDQVSELQTQIETVGQLRNEDLDMLQRTEIGQRDVAGQLTSPVQGLERRARNLLQELRGNHLDDPQAEHRLEEISSELGRLAEDRFPAIEQGLTQARKLAQMKSSRGSSSGDKGRQRSPERGNPKPSGASEREKATPGDSNPTASRKPASPVEEKAGRQAQENPKPSEAANPSGASASAERSENNTPSRAEGDTAKSSEQNQSAETGKTDPSDRQRDERSKGSAGSSETPEGALRQAAENQEEVLSSMEELLQDLSQWRNEYDASREVTDLILQQETLKEKTGELGRQTLTRSREKLSPQEQADLARLAERQKKQADQFEQLQARLKEKVASAPEAGAPSTAALSDALEQSREQAVPEQMREAAGQIGENRMGEASRSQDEILQKLRDLEKTLNEHHESDSETLVKKLKQAVEDLQSLREREEELLRKVEAASAQSDPAQRRDELMRLEKQQRQLRDETAKAARRLERLRAHRSAASAQRAASRMQQAQESAAQGESGEASRQQQEALEDLEQAQRDAARELQRAEEQLAFEQLETIAGELKSMIDMLEAAIVETRRLDTLRKASGRLTRGQLQALNDLVTTQRNLREDTDRLAEKLTAAKVFAQALRGASRSMQRAVELLQARETGEETQQNQQAAKRRFVDMVDAWKNQDDNKGGKQSESGQNGQGAQSGPPMESIPGIAELRMLVSLQKELLERTDRLNELRESGATLSEAQEAEFNSLTLEQSELADLTRNFLRKAGESGSQ